MQRGFLSIAAVLVIIGSGSARADILDEWASAKTPPPPEMKPVTVDPKATALLVLDLIKPNCSSRPRCLATLPTVKKLLGEARAAQATIIFTRSGQATLADVIDPDIAPISDEPSLLSAADKFLNTNLADLLKQKGIKTIITVGTAAHAAVLMTASEAALRNYDVIVPIDGISDSDVYREQYSVYQLAVASTISQRITLTRVNMMKF